MADVIIGSNTYKALVDVATAAEYISGSISANADLWLAGTDDFQGRTLISAQRIFDRMSWLGTPTADPQDNSWPRDGVDVDGFVDGTTPTDIINGLLELTMTLAGNTEFADNSSSGSNIKRAKGGEAEVWFFRSTEESASPLPNSSWSWVKKYIDGGEGIGSADYGTYSDSSFESVFDDEQAMLREQGLM